MSLSQLTALRFLSPFFCACEGLAPCRTAGWKPWAGMGSAAELLFVKLKWDNYLHLSVHALFCWWHMFMVPISSGDF